MKQYTIELDLRVEDCLSCPFRQEALIHENVNSQDGLSGTVGVIRKSTICGIKGHLITFNLPVFNNPNCPLRDQY